jgi:hypothetical protein
VQLPHPIEQLGESHFFVIARPQRGRGDPEISIDL